MNVEIWSDIACPWCYVGKRRFEQALAAFEHRDEVDVTWRSFELDPSAPRERGVDAATHLAEKYGMSREQALAMQQRMAGVGAGEGLDFRHDLARGGNTFDAHRLLHLAADHELQDTLKERLLRAYHSEGEPIGDPATLERLAEGGQPPRRRGARGARRGALWRGGPRRRARCRLVWDRRRALLRGRPFDRRLRRPVA